MASNPTITTILGQPVDDNQNSVTAGEKGPIVIGDTHLIEKLAHFDRERIPERVVHAKGAGAHGYFEVTHDIRKYCKASVFSQVGKKTPVFLRFSTVGGEKGSSDCARDPRGFALKHYTEEGNWDMVGNNTPIFFIRDPIKFPDFIHTQKRNPQTNLPDPNAFWDFLSLVPESVHQVTILFSGRGTPNGYRHMNGYSSHSFKMVNAEGDVFYVKFHYKTDQGIENLDRHQAASFEPDYATRDLFNAIEEKQFPSWTLYLQVMPVAEAATYRYNVLDVTKVWPHKDYPLIPVGKLVLNKNPLNYYAEVEQAAFSPGNVVPGIEPSEDKMLQGRLFSYPDTHRHRLGANFDQIPINRAWGCPKNDYNIRDGPMCVDGNKGKTPNYEPNSTPGTAKQDPNYASSKPAVSGVVARHPPPPPIVAGADDYIQAGELFRTVMDDKERDFLIDNIVNHLCNARRDIQERQVKVFAKADPEYGRRVAAGLGLPSAAL